MNWWDLGEHSGYRGSDLATHQIECAFCGESGNFETINHLDRKKAGDSDKKLNYDTLKCVNCGNYIFAFWSASYSMHDYHVVPWRRNTSSYPKHWPDDIGTYWLEAKRSIEAQNWTAAALMARSALQLIARLNDAKGENLKQELDDLAARGIILTTMREWADEIRYLGNEGAHPKPGSTGADVKNAKDVVEFLTTLMTVMYDLPKKINDYRSRKK
jgi:hypothetical protein